MERPLIFIFLLTIMESSVIKQYHYISSTKYWSEAQAYCRDHYDELAFVDSLEDQIALEKAAGVNLTLGLFGLHRDLDNITGWKWSGGGYATYTYWGNGQPNKVAVKRENIGHISPNGLWEDVTESTVSPFYCVSLPAVEDVRKSWEEAEEHCRRSSSGLVSLRSDTELLLLQRLMVHQGPERIWIGLRFLSGDWFWVNGDPLTFQAWADGGRDPKCPPLGRCGALSAGGRWETVDCQERLFFVCN